MPSLFGTLAPIPGGEAAPKTHRNWLWGLGALALVALGLLFWAKPWQRPLPTLVVARQDLQELVELSGTVEAAASLTLKAEATGVVAELLVAENAVAGAGHILARLKPEAARLQWQQAQANAKAAIALARTQRQNAWATFQEVEARQGLQAQSLRRRMEKVRLQLEQASKDLERNKALAHEGGISPQALDQQIQGRAQLEQDLGLAQDELQRFLSGTERVAARNALAQADTALNNALRQGQASVALAQKALKDTELRAPFSGSLTDWLVEVGQYVSPGMALAQFQDLAHLRLRLPVDELDLPKLRVGGEVDITFDAYSDEPLKGRIFRISKASVLGSSNVQVFPVEVAFEDPQDRIRPGMSADARMVVRELKDVIALPLAAVRRHMESHFVTVVQGNKRVEREVKPGISTLDAVEILSGLSVGELVEDPRAVASPSAKP